MTDAEKEKAYKYLSYKTKGISFKEDAREDYLNYVLDRLNEFSDMTVIDDFLVDQAATEKQDRIAKLEAELIILKA